MGEQNSPGEGSRTNPGNCPSARIQPCPRLPQISPGLDFPCQQLLRASWIMLGAGLATADPSRWEEPGMGRLERVLECWSCVGSVSKEGMGRWRDERCKDPPKEQPGKVGGVGIWSLSNSNPSMDLLFSLGISVLCPPEGTPAGMSSRNSLR